VPATVTVDEHGLIRRVVYNFQELRSSISRGPGAIAHADAEELHSRGLYQSLLVSLTVILQINDCLDPGRGESGVIPLARLSASIKLFIDTAKVLDSDFGNSVALSSQRYG